jgi:hypothetical protein
MPTGCLRHSLRCSGVGRSRSWWHSVKCRTSCFDRDAYRWDLWAAAYVINGGASDDGFEYFLGWLMAQGRTRWEATRADPDSLADIVDADTGDLDGEELLYIALAAAG